MPEDVEDCDKEEPLPPVTDDASESPSFPPEDDRWESVSALPALDDSNDGILRDRDSDRSDRPTLASIPPDRDRPLSFSAATAVAGGFTTACCGTLPTDDCGLSSAPLLPLASSEPSLEPRLFPPDECCDPPRTGPPTAPLLPAESRLSLLPYDDAVAFPAELFSAPIPSPSL